MTQTKALPDESRESGIPSNEEVVNEPDPIRASLLAAIQRLLLGHPKVVSRGAKTVRDLALEAGVGRHYLYKNHPDLRYRFEYLRDRSEELSEAEQQLRASLERAKLEILRLRSLHSTAREEARDSKGLVRHLARVVNALQEELHQEQVTTERLTRRLQRVEGQPGGLSPVVLVHRRSSKRPNKGTAKDA